MLKPAVETRNVDGILVAEFWDCFRLDPAPVQDLRQHYETHVADKSNKPQAVIDLLGVGFAGSAALGNFMAMHRLVKQHGGRLIFCNVDPTVFEVFRVSKLDPLFTFVTDRDAGLEEAKRDPVPAGSETNPGAAGSAPAQDETRSSRGTGLLSASRRRKLS